MIRVCSILAPLHGSIEPPRSLIYNNYYLINECSSLHAVTSGGSAVSARAWTRKKIARESAEARFRNRHAGVEFHLESSRIFAGANVSFLVGERGNAGGSSETTRVRAIWRSVVRTEAPTERGISILTETSVHWIVGRLMYSASAASEEEISIDRIRSHSFRARCVD